MSIVGLKAHTWLCSVVNFAGLDRKACCREDKLQVVAFAVVGNLIAARNPCHILVWSLIAIKSASLQGKCLFASRPLRLVTEMTETR